MGLRPRLAVGRLGRAKDRGRNVVWVAGRREVFGGSRHRWMLLRVLQLLWLLLLLLVLLLLLLEQGQLSGSGGGLGVAVRLRARHLVGKLLLLPLAQVKSTGNAIGMLQLGRTDGGVGAGSHGGGVAVDIDQV